jgi:hypothetical protein
LARQTVASSETAMDDSCRDERARLPSDLPSTTGASPSTSNAARPWRCRGCGAVLGLLRVAELHLRRGEVELWITGACRHRCRRCGTTNAIRVPEAGGAR